MSVLLTSRLPFLHPEERHERLELAAALGTASQDRHPSKPARHFVQNAFALLFFEDAYDSPFGIKQVDTRGRLGVICVGDDVELMTVRKRKQKLAPVAAVFVLRLESADPSVKPVASYTSRKFRNPLLEVAFLLRARKLSWTPAQQSKANVSKIRAFAVNLGNVSFKAIAPLEVTGGLFSNFAMKEANLSAIARFNPDRFRVELILRLRYTLQFLQGPELANKTLPAGAVIVAVACSGETAIEPTPLKFLCALIHERVEASVIVQGPLRGLNTKTHRNPTDWRGPLYRRCGTVGRLPLHGSSKLDMNRFGASRRFWSRIISDRFRRSLFMLSPEQAAQPTQNCHPAILPESHNFIHQKARAA